MFTILQIYPRRDHGPFYYPSCTQCLSLLTAHHAVPASNPDSESAYLIDLCLRDISQNPLLETYSSTDIIYKCTKCNHHCSSNKLKYRWHIKIRVASQFSTSTISIFGSILDQLFGCSAQTFPRNYDDELVVKIVNGILVGSAIRLGLRKTRFSKVVFCGLDVNVLKLLEMNGVARGDKAHIEEGKIFDPVFEDTLFTNDECIEKPRDTLCFLSSSEEDNDSDLERIIDNFKNL